MEKPAVNNRVQVTAFGEFLLRLHSNHGKRIQQTDGYTAYYAGSEANVCVLLSRLGIPVNYTTRIPHNDLALAGVQQLKSQGVGTDDIIYGGDKLGLFFTETGNGIRPTRVIYDRNGAAYANLQRGMMDWKKILSSTEYFHWSGVAPAISASAAEVCAEAIDAARDAGVLISADFNYRSKLWQYGKAAKEVMPGLLRHSQVAVADLDAIQIYYGIETNTQWTLEDRFKKSFELLQQQIPGLRTLGMSFRKPTDHLHPLYFAALAHEGQFVFSEGYVLQQITDPVGTGDAFTAGLLYGLLQQQAPQQIINFATACGAIKQSIAGDWAITGKAEIEELMQHGISGRIAR